MIEKKLALINEQTSPLFRIMSINDINIPNRKGFDNNISAFHIGNGFILSVAHNHRSEAQILRSIEETIYQTEILIHLDATETMLFNKCYSLDSNTNKRYIVQTTNQNDLLSLVKTFRKINFDSRWITLTQKNVCNPYLIIQFKNNTFYNDPSLSKHFTVHTNFSESGLNRHTFLIELKLVKAFYENDISIYKIVNTHADITKIIPSIEVDYKTLDDNENNLYCIQSSPGGFLGRLLNNAKIEGHSDNHSILPDRFGGNYILEGNRYVIKGYFRFGSSGAPYVVYDSVEEKFKVNAIQSEACPIQLAINNSQDGNFQYINAIASPLRNIQTELEDIIQI